MHSLAIANHKGGVGKTTTVVNLAACLAEAGRSVLRMARANAEPIPGVTRAQGDPSVTADFEARLLATARLGVAGLLSELKDLPAAPAGRE